MNRARRVREQRDRERVWSESPEDGNAMRRQGFRLQFPLSGRQVWNERAGHPGCHARVTRGLTRVYLLCSVTT